jgi:hypothetical protein
LLKLSVRQTSSFQVIFKPMAAPPGADQWIAKENAVTAFLSSSRVGLNAATTNGFHFITLLPRDLITPTSKSAKQSSQMKNL